MFGVFTPSIKSDCLFLGIFPSFHRFVPSNFDKLAPPEYMFQKMLQVTFLSIPAQKTVSEELKTCFFS